MRRFTRAMAAMLVLGFVLGAACVADDETSVATTSDDAGAPWASEAMIWHEARSPLIAELGGAAWEYFWDPQIDFDFRSMMPGAVVLKGMMAYSFMHQLMPPESSAYVDLGPSYVATDGVVFLNALDWAPSGRDNLPITAMPAQLGNVADGIGRNGAQRMRSAFSTFSWRERYTTDATAVFADEAESIAGRWIDTWKVGVAAPSLYAADAHLVDSIAGVEATGIDQLAGWLPAPATLDWNITETTSGIKDVYPLMTSRFDLDGVLFIVDGDDGNACPGRVAVLVSLDGGLVVDETHFREVEDARRCVGEARLPDGWWSMQNLDFDEPYFPSEDLETVTGVIDVEGNDVELYNSTERLDGLVEWGFQRFGTAGLALPVVESITFTQYAEFCSDIRGRAVRREAGWDLYLCFHEDEACSSDDCAYFSLVPKHVVLHELAHPWLATNVDADARKAFMARVGLEAWKNGGTPWVEQAREHAAETMAWGLFDTPLTLFSIGRPDDQSLREHFIMLTGVEPLQGVEDQG